MIEKKETQDEIQNDEPISQERREALKKMGKYAYVAPAVVTLLASRRVPAQSAPPTPPATTVTP